MHLFPTNISHFLWKSAIFGIIAQYEFSTFIVIQLVLEKCKRRSDDDFDVLILTFSEQISIYVVYNVPGEFALGNFANN